MRTAGIILALALPTAARAECDFESAYASSAAELRALFDQGCALSQRDADAMLMDVVNSADVATAELLIRRGHAQVNQVGAEGYTPLASASIHHGWRNTEACQGELASEARCAFSHLSMVKLLLRHGAAPSSRNVDGRTPFHEAIGSGRFDVARLLIEGGANVGAADHSGSTPLHGAAWAEIPSMVQALLAAGADPRARDCRGRTPLSAVAASDSAATLAVARKLIASGADVDVTDRHGESVVQQAATADNVAIVRLLLEHGADARQTDEYGRTALHRCSGDLEPGSRRIIELLLQYGGDIDAQDREGRTPLFAAIARESHEPGAVAALLERGADVALHAKGGLTPLHVAAYAGNDAAVVHLLARGAAVETRDDHGNAALHYAALGGHVDAVRRLLLGGADPAARSHAGRTPRELAELACHTLIELRAAPRCMLDVSTPLHAAALDGRLSSLYRLLVRRVTVDVRDARGRTPLHRATERWGADRDSPLTMVMALLAENADVNARDDRARRPLHAAAAGPWMRGAATLTAGLLLCAGADVDARDAAGMTASDLARMHGWPSSELGCGALWADEAGTDGVERSHWRWSRYLRSPRQ